MATRIRFFVAFFHCNLVTIYPTNCFMLLMRQIVFLLKKFILIYFTSCVTLFKNRQG
jgi:hypothetical protein